MSRTFDGSAANYLGLGSLSNSNQSTDYSFFVYVKPDAQSSLRAIVSMGNSGRTGDPRMALSIDASDNSNAFSQYGSQVQTTDASISEAGTWQFLAYAYDASLETHYIWGNDATASSAGSVTDGVSFFNMDQLHVGAFADSTVSSAFDGLIAEVVFFKNYVLTNANISTLSAETTQSGFDSAVDTIGSVEAHWTLRGTDLTDRTSNLGDLVVNGTVSDSSDDPLTAAVTGTTIVVPTGPWR